MIQYISQRAFKNSTIFDESEINSFINKVKETKDKKYNEVLARTRWNIKKSSICVFSDNIETRWVATNWAEKMDEKIHAVSKIEFEKGNITAEEFQLYMSSKTPVSFYFPDKKKSGIYSQESLAQDRAAALAIFDIQESRKKELAEGNYEFLLMLQDANRINEVIENQHLMSILLQDRLFIAEYLIDKYHALTQKNCMVKDANKIAYKNITRTLLQKIANGQLQGFEKDATGRIVIFGYEITNKDLSNLDLSMFNFNNCTFHNVFLKNVKLDLRDSNKVTFSNCNFMDTDTKKLNFQNTTIIGELIYNDKEPNPQLFEKMPIEKFAINHKLDDVMTVIDQHKNKTPLYLITTALQLASNEEHSNAVDQLVEKINLHYARDKDFAKQLLMFSAKLGRVDILRNQLEKNTELTIETKDNDGNTPLLLSIKNNRNEAVNQMLQHYPQIDINTYDNEGNCAIYYAISNNNEAMIRSLLSKKANFLFANDYETAQLLLRTTPSILNLLLDQYPHLLKAKFKEDDEEHTLLTSAIKESNSEAIKLILDKDIRTLDYQMTGFRSTADHSPIFYALSLGKNDIANHIIKVCPDVFNSTFRGNKALYHDLNLAHYAIETKNIAFLREIITQHPSLLKYTCPSAHFQAGYPPLCRAIQNDNLDAVKVILETCSNALNYCITDYYRRSYSPLAFALAKDKKDIIEYILKKHPEAIKCIIKSNRDSSEHTALTLYIEEGKLNTVKQIFALSPESISYENRDGRGVLQNALIFALDLKQQEMISALVSEESINAILTKSCQEVKLRLLASILNNSDILDQLTQYPQLEIYLNDTLNNHPQDLMVAAMANNYIDAVKYIGEKNPRSIKLITTIPPYQGFQPYHYARKAKDYNIRELSNFLDSQLATIPLETTLVDPYLLTHIKSLTPSNGLKVLFSNTDFSNLSTSSSKEELQLIEFVAPIIATLSREELNDMMCFLAKDKEMNRWSRQFMNQRADWNSLPDPILTAIEYQSDLAFEMMQRTSPAILLESRNNRGHNALTLAIEKADIQVIKELIKDIDKATLDNMRWHGHNILTLVINTLIYTSTPYEKKEPLYSIIRSLLDKSPDLLNYIIQSEDKSLNGLSPFAYSFKLYNEKFPAELIDKFPQILDYKSTYLGVEVDGFSEMLKNSSLQTVTKVLNNNPDRLNIALTSKEMRGYTPVSYLMSRDFTKSASLFNIIKNNPTLLTHVVNKSSDDHGLTPLFVAIKHDRLSYVKEILTQYPDYFKSTIAFGKYAGLDLVTFAIQSMFHNYSKDLPILSFLLKHKPELLHTPLQHPNFQGETPFMYALKNGDQEFLKKLFIQFPTAIKDCMQQKIVQPALALAVLDTSKDLSTLLLNHEPTLKEFTEDQIKNNAANLMVTALSESKEALAKKIAEQNPEAIHSIIYNGPHQGKSAYSMALSLSYSALLNSFKTLTKDIQPHKSLDSIYTDINKALDDTNNPNDCHLLTMNILLRQIDYTELMNTTNPEGCKLRDRFYAAVKHLNQDELTHLFLLSLRHKEMNNWSMEILAKAPAIDHQRADNHKLSEGKNSLMMAIANDNLPLVVTIMNKAPESINYVISDPESKYHGFNALTLAILLNKPDMVKKICASYPHLIAEKIKGNKLYDGYTPMALAASKNKKLLPIMAEARLIAAQQTAKPTPPLSM